MNRKYITLWNNKKNSYYSLRERGEKKQIPQTTTINQTRKLMASGFQNPARLISTLFIWLQAEQSLYYCFTFTVQTQIKKKNKKKSALCYRKPVSSWGSISSPGFISRKSFYGSFTIILAWSYCRKAAWGRERGSMVAAAGKRTKHWLKCVCFIPSCQSSFTNAYLTET